MNVTEGKLLKVDFVSVKTKETIGNKVVVDSDQEFAHLTLDTGAVFLLSGKSGHEVASWGTGHKLSITQDKGIITIDKV